MKMTIGDDDDDGGNNDDDDPHPSLQLIDLYISSIVTNIRSIPSIHPSIDSDTRVTTLHCLRGEEE